MTLILPELKGLVVGEYGKSHSLTLKDFEGAAQNVATYTGITVVCRSPEGTKTLALTGSFLTDGTDGVITWSFSTGSFIDRPGIWEGQVELTKTGYKTKSYPFNAEVQKSLRN